MRRRVEKFLPLVMWMLTITWLSSQSSTRLPSGAWMGHDKLLHGAAYAAGGALAFLAVPEVIAAVGIVSAFGAADEWHQSYTPGRSPDVRDWMADTVGAIVGAGAGWWLFRRRKSSA
jgi:hypothetical protein